MARMIKGVPVTDQEIKRLAAEAERGYPVEQLRKRGRRTIGDGPGRVVSIRLDETLVRAIEARGRRDHKNDSEVIRDAVRAWV